MPLRRARGGSGTGEDAITLADGRRLGFAEYGSPAGRPLLVFQGTPTSRLPHNPLETREPARLIVPERPGFGLSDFQPGRRLLDWPSDVAQLADRLGIDRFSVAGISGGGPHALAVGVRLAPRIHRLGVVSGIGPLDAPGASRGMARQRRVGSFFARHLAFLAWPLIWAFRTPARNPERFVERFTSGFPAADRELLARPEIRSLRARSYAEATARGVRGFAWEVVMLARPWDFSPGDVACDVHLWHGVEDASTPVAMARHLAASLPRCRAVELPGEGHFVAVRHWDEIVGTLTGER